MLILLLYLQGIFTEIDSICKCPSLPLDGDVRNKREVTLKNAALLTSCKARDMIQLLSIESLSIDNEEECRFYTVTTFDPGTRVYQETPFHVYLPFLRNYHDRVEP